MFFLLAFFLFQKDFSIEMQVRERLINVHVLDEKGLPVSGLSMDDFIVHENNLLRKLTYFQEVNVGGGGEAVSDPIIQGGDISHQSFQIVLIDSSFMMENSFHKLINELVHFFSVQSLSNTKFKIVHLDQELKQITPFTNSKELLKKGLKSIEYKGTMWKKVKDINFQIVRSAEMDKRSILSKGPKSLLYMRLESKEKIISSYYEMAIRSLIGSTYILKPYHGSKSILLFTGGGYRDNYSDLGDGTLENLTSYLIKLLNSTGSTLHGFRVDDGRPGVSKGNLLRQLQQDRLFGNELKKPKQSQRFKTMTSLTRFSALGTGGLSFLLKGKRSLNQGLKLTKKFNDSCYLLGYSLSDKDTGGKLVIKLKSDSNKYKLYYGKDLLDIKPFSKMVGLKKQMAFEAAFFYENPNLNPPLLWRSDSIQLSEGVNITVFCGKLKPDQIDTLEIGGCILGENDEPLDYCTWKINDGERKSGHYFFILESKARPKKARLFYLNTSTGDYYVDQKQPARTSDAKLKMVFFGQELPSNQCFNQLQPLFHSGIVQTNLFQGENFIFMPAFEIVPEKPIYSFFLIDKSCDLGNSFSVDLSGESTSETYFAETKILNVERGSEFLSVVSEHAFPGHLQWNGQSELKVTGESKEIFKVHTQIPLTKITVP